VAEFDLHQNIFDEVGRRTALIAERQKDASLAVEERNFELVRGFIDDGMNKVAVTAGLMRDQEPVDAGEVVDVDTDLTDDIVEVLAFNKSDYANPSDDMMADFIPPEFHTCIVYYAMAEWFDTIGGLKLGAEYRVKYQEELSEHRFSPGEGKRAVRPYRPI
jgi:hypothetical protein